MTTLLVPTTIECTHTHCEDCKHVRPPLDPKDTATGWCYLLQSHLYQRRRCDKCLLAELDAYRRGV